MPFVAPIVAGIGSLVGGAAAGVAGLAGAAASAVGTVASGVLGAGAGLVGGAADVVGGTIGALTGGAGAVAPSGLAYIPDVALPAALQPTAALGVPAATGGIASGLETILSGVQVGVGIKGQLAQLEIAEGMSETEKIKAQTALMEAEALKVYAAKPPTPTPTPTPTALPTLSAQPVYVEPELAAPAAAPNYLLYIGLAILAFILLRKK